MKIFRFLFILFLFLRLSQGCKSSSTEKPEGESFPVFFNVGHRGAGGLMPENTIPSMKTAIDEGVNFLEVDVQISRDNKVVVYHDPYINREFTLQPDWNEIPEEESKEYIIHQMDYKEIREFKIVKKSQSGFPEQRKIVTYIPLLGELIDSVETYTSNNNLSPVNYLIEVKAAPEKDGEYQPNPKTYINLVMGVLEEKPIRDRFYLQSFDIRQIQEIRNEHPEIIVGFLTGNRDVTFEDNIEALGFFPDVYSPHFNLATEELIKKAHQNDIKFVPWTVNSEEVMWRLLDMEVDGIITDYPNLLRKILQK